ncbi:DUF4328 domain-containing protein [Streptomyces sp. B21-083]|uniref:DUF4328 domain-containing protein n=1 Tax=Streptomyces sp. B21-083 TaxID=3039410 RepID=UPI002FF2DA0E
MAALADVFRALAVRDLHLHDTVEPSHKLAFVSMVFLYLMTLAIVLFLVWLARSRRNAQELSPRASVPSPGWTIGVWFIPVVNLFVPRRLILDIGRASSSSWGQRRNTTLVNLWWVAWVSHTLVLVAAAQVAPGSMAFLVAAETFMIAAAVLLGLVIERVTEMQSSALAATMPAAPLAQA